MSRPLPPETIARAARIVTAMLLAMDVVLAGLVFYLLGFAGPHNIALAGVIAVVFLVVGCLVAWFYRRNTMAVARRAAQQGANSQPSDP